MNRAHVPDSRLKVRWKRLNGGTLGFADPSATSAAKGETLADTARMVTNYADIIVVRHNWAGSARVMAQYAHIPVINGGDGSHTHPTQALADLYTIIRRKSEVAGLTVGICGDLQFGRAAHSFALAVAKVRWETNPYRTEAAPDASVDTCVIGTPLRSETA